jgi:hypothetical protein
MHRLVIVWVVVLVACAQTVADDALRACAPLCGCAEPLPAAQQDCTGQCITEFERSPLTEACIVCIDQHRDRCATLLGDCTSLCTQAVPLRSYVSAASPTGSGL